MFDNIITSIKASKIYQYVTGFPIINDLIKIIAKIGTFPIVLGMLMLLLGKEFAFVHSWVAKTWLTVGWIISFLFVDKIVFPKYDLAEEIKKGNLAIALFAGCLILGLALLWM